LFLSQDKGFDFSWIKMSRAFQTGYEISILPTGGDISPPDGLFSTSGTGVASRDTAIKRTGASSCKLDPAAGDSGVWMGSPFNFVVANNRIFYLQAYMYFDDLPSVTVQVMQLYSGATPAVSVRLTAAGKIQLYDNGAVAQIGSDSVATLVPDTWYRIALKAANNASSLISSAEVQLDGVSVANGNIATPTAGPNVRIGWIEAPGANKVMHIDDLVGNDSTDGLNDSWPGEDKVILMMPKSDEQIGSWKAGAGGSTNLWDAVSNVPPLGIAAETDLSQIENFDVSGDNSTDEYRGNCGSYLAAGIGASDIITSVSTFANHAEKSAAGSVAGSFGAQSNPSEIYSVFNYGGNVGAAGTWPANWRWKLSNALDLPSVVLQLPLIVAIRKTDATTTVGFCDFLGAYVAYEQLEITYGPPQLERKASQRALTRRRM